MSRVSATMFTSIIRSSFSGSAVAKAPRSPRPALFTSKSIAGFRAAEIGCDQFIDFIGSRKIGLPNLDLQLRMPRAQFRAQFFEPIRPPRDQEQRRGTARKLAGELPADPGRGSGHQRVTAFELHRGFSLS